MTKFERQPEPVESNELLAFINVALRFDLPDLILAERDMGSRINPEPGHSNMAFRRTPVPVFAVQHVEQTHAYVGGEILSGL